MQTTSNKKNIFKIFLAIVVINVVNKVKDVKNVYIKVYWVFSSRNFKRHSLSTHLENFNRREKEKLWMDIFSVKNRKTQK